MFSVIIPLYNKENNISSTIKSVLDQTFSDFELIIVNDGSTDNSLNVVKNISDSRIRIIDKPNGGVSSARNRGINEAENEYIAFLDGDDLWTHDHLQTMSELIHRFDNNSIGGYSTAFIKIQSYSEYMIGVPSNDNGRIINSYFEEQSYPFELLSSSNFVIKRSKIGNLRYNENIRYGEDVEFWYNFFGVNNNFVVKTEKVTCFYYVGAENRSVSKVIPLSQRFSDFNFQGKSESEKKYLGKLVAISVIDYLLQKRPAIALRIAMKNKKHFHYAMRYFSLLINKKIKY